MLDHSTKTDKMFNSSSQNTFQNCSKTKVIVHFIGGLETEYLTVFNISIDNDILSIPTSAKHSVHIPIKNIMYYELKTV